MPLGDRQVRAGPVSAPLADGLARNRRGGGFAVGCTTDPGAGQIRTTSTIRSDTGFNVKGTGGLASATLTVRDSGGAADCNIVVSGGIITSSTC